MFDQIARKYGVMNYAMGGPVMMAEGGFVAGGGGPLSDAERQRYIDIKAAQDAEAAAKLAAYTPSDLNLAQYFQNPGQIPRLSGETEEAAMNRLKQMDMDRTTRMANRDAMRAQMGLNDVEIDGVVYGAGVSGSGAGSVTPAPFSTAPAAQAAGAATAQTPGDMSAIYNQLADQIYGRKNEAWNVDQRSLENWEYPLLQGKSAKEAEDIFRYSIAKWRAENPEKFVPPAPVLGVNPGPGTPIVTPVQPDVPPPYRIPDFTPPGLINIPMPYTNPDGSTIYPNSIQTPQGPQPTYFPTSWWTNSPSASEAYGQTTPSTARNFNTEMDAYRAKYAPVLTRPTPPSTPVGLFAPPAPGTPAAPNQATKPTQDPGPGMEWFWNGSNWVVQSINQNNVIMPGDSGYSGGGYAHGGEVNTLWNKYHG
jgi:hypothetical protein